MDQGMLHLHNLLRWVILILLLVVIFKSMGGSKKPFTPGNRKWGLALLISADVMLLIGVYQWFTGNWGLKSIQANGMSEVMKNTNLRFFAIEHLVGMVLAIIFIHIGYSFAKRKLADSVKHRRSLLFYSLALLIILIFIPWPFREFGRPLFPGMN